MIGVSLGAAAFLVLFWVDAVSLKGLSLVKPFLWLASTALFLAGLLDTASQPPFFRMPGPLLLTGWVLFSMFALLLVYSLFVEIPFVSAYVKKGRPSQLVTQGTYALCRHPGVLWLTGLLAGFFLSHGSLWLLVALPVWVGLDTIYVILQERLFFLRMFGAEYQDYQRRVPMLIPTARSVRECARTIFTRQR